MNALSDKNSKPFDWCRYDQNHLWHPYSSMLDPAPAFPVVHAEGVELELVDGRRLVDGMSSWWAAVHGYNVPKLNRALKEQIDNFSHVMFGGLTHEPASQLARRLIEMTAEPLQYLFLSDSGSISVEVALKMALQYWMAQGQTKRCRLMTVRGGYHGDTFNCMAVSDPLNSMHDKFHHMLPKHIFAPKPEWSEENSSDANTSIAEFERLIYEHQDEIAAVILEPILQAAGGMNFYSPDYLRKVRSLCDETGILLILDEIATGFGRTGTLFAYEQADIIPDILCLGKALTGGYMTLAATLTTKQVVEGINAADNGLLMHGPTFMGNPLACSAANASIDLLLDSPWEKRVMAIEVQLKAELTPCISFDCVSDVSVQGAVGVVKLTEPVDMRWIQPRIVELGVWIRPFGKLLYIMPPYIITATELRKLTSAITIIVSEISKNR